MRRKPCSPPLPLVVVCPVPANESVEEHFVRRCLNIDDLILGGLINDMSLCVLPYGDEDLPEGIDVANPEISEKVREVFEMLFRHSLSTFLCSHSGQTNLDINIALKAQKN